MRFLSANGTRLLGDGSEEDVRGIAFLLALWLAPPPHSSARADDPRSPLPSSDQTAQARRLIDATYKEEFSASDRPARLGLGRNLLARSRDAGTDLPMKYVLLSLARDVADSAGDPSSALAAIDDLTKSFQVDEASTKIEFLEPRVAKASATEDLVLYVEYLLRALPQKIEADDLGTTERLLAFAEVVAAKAADADATRRVTGASLRLKAVQANQGAYEAARATLGRDPSDAHANHVAGFHRCFLLGQWEGGLEQLVQGDDPDLASVAALELKRPAEVESRLKLADRWFEISSRQAPAAQGSMRVHASVLYRRVFHQLKELDKGRVAKRLSEIDPVPVLPKVTPKFVPADWRLDRRPDGKWESFPVDAATGRAKGTVFSVKNPGDPGGHAKLVFAPRWLDGDFTIWLKYRGQLHIVSLGDPIQSPDRILYLDDLPSDRSKWHSVVLRRTRDGLTAWIDDAPAQVTLHDSDEFMAGFFCVELANGQEIDLRDFAVRGGSPR